MNEAETIALIDKLRAYSTEREWFEFKENHCAPEELGEYISALANSACLNDKPYGYLIFGIRDKTHEVVGTTYNPYTEKGKGEQPLQLWLTMGLQPNLGFSIYPVLYSGKKVVVFEINAAVDRPVSFHSKEWVRIDGCKTELRKHPEKVREIWNRKYRMNDWSAQICERATPDDLEPDAILKARAEFKAKYPSQAPQVDAWDDITFLNKAKVTIQNRITNAAILLLGRPESAALIAPAVARISWILKDNKNAEKDYQHFGPPFLLSVAAVFNKVRNLTIRHLPDGTLFPLETTQYDPWVLREALHNCIAHQNYALQGRINVVETPNAVTLTNVGSFLPGTVENVIQQDAPQEIYRNPFLSEAMVHLNMIDTQGGGIKKMFTAQVKRFFPLPDYDLSNSDRVAVTLRGEIIDEKYTKLLISKTNLDLWSVILLDKVQKGLQISKDEFKRLKTTGTVDGRYPNLFISSFIAKAIGAEAQHIRSKGFKKKHYLERIVELIREYQPVSRNKIDELLFPELPDIINESQKKTRIHNYLCELVRIGRIINNGSDRASEWVLFDFKISKKSQKKSAKKSVKNQ
jgi:ATP-dependent DNA helicase RecG